MILKKIICSITKNGTKTNLQSSTVTHKTWHTNEAKRWEWGGGGMIHSHLGPSKRRRMRGVGRVQRWFLRGVLAPTAIWPGFGFIVKCVEGKKISRCTFMFPAVFDAKTLNV